MTVFGASVPSKIEIVIRKSRFVGLCCPLEGLDAAAAWLDGVKKTYAGATHVCYAVRGGVNGNETRYADDGEPKGTAGLPILEVLKKNGAVRTAIAVARYYGGIKLGAGGLQRAYTETAAAAFLESKPVEFVLAQLFLLETDYETAGRITGAQEIARHYGDRVKIEFGADDPADLFDRLAEQIGGIPDLKPAGMRILPVKRDS